MPGAHKPPVETPKHGLLMLVEREILIDLGIVTSLARVIGEALNEVAEQLRPGAGVVDIDDGRGTEIQSHARQSQPSTVSRPSRRQGTRSLPPPVLLLRVGGYGSPGDGVDEFGEVSHGPVGGTTSGHSAEDDVAVQRSDVT
ncbi:hypothetical protein GCM10014713_36090 [Streptomyces purpureus]|uniref:Uncharacterized protein n=1 Tax=Streptomyces purpureus TaxID=1951 RepID=A0A918H5Q6_9ACTN|nr:hypothetical protein GCM10014713_36090 [Streptomyces purpureus]